MKTNRRTAQALLGHRRINPKKTFRQSSSGQPAPHVAQLFTFSFNERGAIAKGQGDP